MNDFYSLGAGGAGSDDGDEHDLGLQHDLSTLTRRTRVSALAERRFGRRRALMLLGGGTAAAVVLAACKSASSSASSASSASSGASTTSTTATGAAAAGRTSALSVIPEETAGPYPADGSNGPNVLTTSGIVRSDIRSSFGGMSGTAAGVPLTITLDVLDAGDGNTAKTGAAVYLWHCDREGRYSLYSSGVTDQNYLRGVQVVDDGGQVTFTSIFPACYSGRWPHVHFEVSPSLDAATSASSKLCTSQLALPEAVCNDVYATSEYSASKTNLSRVSLTSDMVFRDDGARSQLATVTGNVSDGYNAKLAVLLD
jgi:protocatechuate 3,4-dioxygenase beta subunit